MSRALDSNDGIQLRNAAWNPPIHGQWSDDLVHAHAWHATFILTCKSAQSAQFHQSQQKEDDVDR
eukprot:2317350-Rhodomonas_salina.1